MRLNLGCGPLRLDGEIGIDRYQTMGADVVANVQALPFAEGAADFVRLDHVLEHLPGKAAVPVLLEAWRVLAPGGQIRIGVPDFMATCREYVGSRTMSDRAIELRHIYGSQTHAGEYHQSGWDKETLVDLLIACGFSGVTVSDDPRDEGICIKAEGVKCHEQPD